MEQYILFRAKKIHTHEAGGGSSIHYGRGSNVGDIVEYFPGDDTRDISWKHTLRTGVMKKKVRIEEDSFPIIMKNTIDARHGFFTNKHPTSPYEYSKAIVEHIKKSAKKYHFPLEMSSDYGVRGRMILYISTDWEVSSLKDIIGMAHHNDLIILHIIHPYEIDPYEDILFDGYGLDRNRYRGAISEKQSILKNYASKHQVPYIQITTDTEFVSFMNNFFKNRIP